MHATDCSGVPTTAPCAARRPSPGHDDYDDYDDYDYSEPPPPVTRQPPRRMPTYTESKARGATRAPPAGRASDPHVGPPSGRKPRAFVPAPSGGVAGAMSMEELGRSSTHVQVRAVAKENPSMPRRCCQ